MEPLTNYLSEAKKILRFLFEKNASIVCLIDVNGNILQANSRLMEIIDLTLNQVREKNIIDFLTKENSEKLNQAIEKMKTGKKVDGLRIKVEKPNGKVRIYKVNGIPLGGEERSQAFLIVAQNITYRKRFEVSLSKFKTLFMKSPVGIELFDSDGENIIVNDACFDIFGVSDPSSIKEIGLFSSPFIPDEAKKRVKNRETVRIEVPYDFKRVKRMGRYETEKEDWMYLDVLIAPITVGKEEEIINYLVYIQDITERKIMEQRLKDSLDRSKFYKDLLAHDIGNILNNIKSSVQLIEMWREEPLKSTKKDNVLKIIKQQIERGRSLISNMRNISKIEEEEQEVSSTEVVPILKEAIELIQSRFQEKTLEIHTDFPEGELKVKGGPFLIDAFENILQNAVVHNNSDKIRIWVSISHLLKQEQNYVKLEFKDNGIGIPDERKKHIFERDYRREKSTGGMGIGLSLVKKIVQQYGGKIRAENRITGDFEQGSNFVVLLKEVN
jgi:PAS domain S-box-containing protein